jgi:hypothetical protein
MAEMVAGFGAKLQQELIERKKRQKRRYLRIFMDIGEALKAPEFTGRVPHQQDRTRIDDYFG